MVAYKFVLMALGLFALTATTSAARIAPGTSLISALHKRGCDVDCNGTLANCPERCAGSGVDKPFVEICHDGRCYCGFPAE